MNLGQTGDWELGNENRVRHRVANLGLGCDLTRVMRDVGVGNERYRGCARKLIEVLSGRNRNV